MSNGFNSLIFHHKPDSAFYRMNLTMDSIGNGTNAMPEEKVHPAQLHLDKIK